MMGGNMQGMMKQMQKMQKQMQAEQAELEATEFVGVAPSDMVKVTFTGDRKLKDVVIAPAIVDPDDVDTLQDMLVVAINDAMTKIDDQTAQTMGKYTRGLGF
ncbi:YbaB/EbfC family nucleoid-associated protein [Periweissella ghanensis]|uniref:Nucleoid-associated protein WGH24286_01137 n=1 Tax=Periweissella ghanensis TaxID=467997 RepID=A0ABM8ZBN4_9LACO|nr:YbaB/EbfC family nucleoid-associated protein [Periweissella ghanensis]MCM0601627.1 YbaB/EbfC family nucleoid-associated protein [Periweissella ghanensis]CAH0418706.1 Nucleoid-associated protein [Periweissella ghanensis]